MAGVHIAVDRLELLANAPVVVDAQVPADADQPRVKVRASIEGIERLEDFQKDLLGQIFGFRMPSDELVRDVEDLPPVLPDDLLPRELVSAQAPLDQRLDRLRRRP